MLTPTHRQHQSPTPRNMYHYKTMASGGGDTSAAGEAIPATTTTHSSNTMNTTSFNATPTPSTAPVPDVLLSLAKDDRYISHISRLLAQSILPLASVLFPRTSSRSDNNVDSDEIINDDGQRFIERIKPELHLVASIIVHSATFVYYSRKYGDVSSIRNGARRSIGMESLNLAYSFGNKNVETPKHPAGFITNSLKQVYNSVSIDRWNSLLIIQTIIPYLIHRAERGGWSKDLGGILNGFLHGVGLSGRRLGAGDETEDDDDSFRNDDRLRGSARRRLFEAQRRRMMSSAQVSDREESVDYAIDDVVQANTEQITLSESTENNQLVRRAKTFAKFSWEFLRRASLAISSLSHGAHTLSRQGGPTVDTSNFDRYTKLLKWCLRLHLALFYWNGAYPTVYHRLVGAKIRDNVPPTHPHSMSGPNAGVIVANRPTYKPIAMLIAMQAMTAFVQATAEASIELVHNIQIALFRRRRQRNLHRNIDEQSSADNSEREVYLDLVEDRVPSIASQKNDEHVTKGKQTRSKKLGKPNKHNSNIHPCGVCLNERVHPAASSVCGHVFCWSCILHWVSNVRSECPLCRAQTRPQDILPLYNYP